MLTALIAARLNFREPACALLPCVCAQRAEMFYSCPFHVLIWSMSMQ